MDDIADPDDSLASEDAFAAAAAGAPAAAVKDPGLCTEEGASGSSSVPYPTFSPRVFFLITLRPLLSSTSTPGEAGVTEPMESMAVRPSIDQELPRL